MILKHTSCYYSIDFLTTSEMITTPTAPCITLRYFTKISMAKGYRKNSAKILAVRLLQISVFDLR